MAFDTSANAAIIRLETRVDAIEKREVEHRQDLKSVLAKLDQLQWWIIGLMASMIGGLLVLLFKR